MFYLAQEVVDPAIGTALMQYPVAALLVAVVAMFLRHTSQGRKEDREDREARQKEFCEALTREQEGMSESLSKLSTQSADTARLFAETMAQTVTKQAELQGKVLEALRQAAS